MTLQDMKPASRREWAFIGAGALVALLALSAITNRYEYRTVGAGSYTEPSVMRIDRWTGGMSRCLAACVALREGSAHPIRPE